MDKSSPLQGPQQYSYFADLELAEDVNLYRPGGFHPVLLGDLLDGRFKVVHKLGYGGQATVWLCQDIKLQKWRALKVFAADASRDDCPDLKLGTLLAGTTPPSNTGPSPFVVPLEHFWLSGPNGRHLCVVLPLLGPPVSRAALHYRKQPAVLNDICAQLVKAMALMHSKGLCHGDFRPSNILLRTSDAIDDLTQEEMFQLLGGKPRLVRVDRCVPEYGNNGSVWWIPVRHLNGQDSDLDDAPDPCPVHDSQSCECQPESTSDHYEHDEYDGEYDDEYECEDGLDIPFDETLPPNVPKYLVVPTRLRLSRQPHEHKPYILPTIAITDFGVCYSPDDATTTTTTTAADPDRKKQTSNNNMKKTTGIPPAYGAPEDFLRVGPLGYATDVWSLAATLFAVVCGTEPFPAGFFGGIQDMMDWLEESYLGPMPGEYKTVWDEALRRHADAVAAAVAADADGNGNDNATGAVEEQVKAGEDGEGTGLLGVSGMSEAYEQEKKKRREEWGTEDALEERMLRHLRSRAGGDEEYGEYEDGDDWERWAGYSSSGGPPEYEYYMSREDIRQFADLLGSMFKWRPQDRASLAQVMRHPWLEGRIVPPEPKVLLVGLVSRFTGCVAGVFRFGIGLVGLALAWARGNKLGMF